MVQLLGFIVLWSGETPPKGWAFCDGATLIADSNPDLNSMIGNTYGGNEVAFNLPKFDNVGNKRYIICVNGERPNR